MTAPADPDLLLRPAGPPGAAAGRRGLFAGKVSSFRGKRQLAHPEYECCSARERRPIAELAAEYAAELIPIYPATARLASWRIAKSVESCSTCSTCPRTRSRPSSARASGLIGRADALRAHSPAARPG